mmetsp:Transcript_14119/g.21307  ORF Transcript_14119/g.21307 Transcript_14119/m.21307 type:complete len:378 (+) Transcript_14119:26-1159(+)
MAAQDPPASILPAFDNAQSCSIDIHFSEWKHIFLVVTFSYLWNLSLIIWTLPWNVFNNNKAEHEPKTQSARTANDDDDASFPYLGSTLSVMFESETFGISLQNWRQLGKKRVDENNIFNIAESGAFKFFVVIFTLNSWILFFAKFFMFLTFGTSLYEAWDARGFADFFNIEIALITLLMVSNIFFSFPILPAFQMASTRSNLTLACLYLLYAEIALTFVLLCVQYPLLISVLYIGACIILTGMVLGMAILCLLVILTVAGCLVFWTLNTLTCFRWQRSVSLRALCASITWLLITHLVWVSGICLAFLFTTSQFQAELCINFARSIYQTICLGLVLLSIVTSVSCVFILKFAFHTGPYQAINDTAHKYQKVQTELDTV